jgi:hypothetical protein
MLSRQLFLRPQVVPYKEGSLSGLQVSIMLEYFNKLNRYSSVNKFFLPNTTFIFNIIIKV